ncbi:MAG: NAD(P)-binding protein [Okeania sp. SIO2G4]|uniref:FAD-dependent oxidoreductase n=1 Tax=unclassified Okeania TaxID=2634635 RepID=UPI0013BE0734|nr:MULTISPECIES: FAD-dependent monooxygenase [unclassified Okeania]NEP41276.1 NAD(P)-binding protein [Okeania sp. SIO2H7]NEP75284.1 NAD(P)-binding protein [Okeania sp. SIO2G5]NEP96362.1 NAD(P)-binding protein [Okeania sp. SIO2F5]NEQ94148.1 NAD(P)-binding protein [Okeania sp. SIO2G4]
MRETSRPVVEKVAIIGGGIGGLATANALRKQGIDAHVYEQARDLRPVGAGLSINPNGLKALETIEPSIVEQLKQAGSILKVINLRKNTGEIIQQTKITMMEKYGQPLLSIRWSKLQEILAAALPPEIIHLNHRCVGFTQNHNSVTVEFEGKKTVEVDLVVGADGVKSAVRQKLIGDGEPRYLGRMSWRGLLKYSHELLSANEVTVITTAPKNFTLMDVGEGYIFWGATMLCVDDSGSGSAADVKSRLIKEFGEWASPVPEIIEATDAEIIVERPIWDREPLSSWSKGRVTLLGDAAHPMSPSIGQGASTAFEDGYELSEYLAKAPNLEAALALYDGNRIERTQIIQARSAFSGRRAYEPDSEKYLQETLSSNEEFEDWLYKYDPLAVASCRVY